MKAFVLAVVVALSVGRVAEAQNKLLADAPTVKLVEAGKDPKKPLRFTAKKGMKKSLTTTMTMSMTMQGGANPMPPQTIPPIQMVVDLKVTDVSADGDIRYEFVLKQPTVVAGKNDNKMVVDAMKETVKGMTGLTGHAVVTNRGFTREADVKMLANANPQTVQLVESLKQSMTSIAAPVPEEAVGVGAKWDTITTLSQNGMTFVQTATNHLTALKGTKATLAITIKQDAKPQKITTQGVTFDLEKYSGAGSGETQFDLAGLVPSSAKMGMKSEMAMSASGQKIGMKIDIQMTMKGK